MSDETYDPMKLLGEKPLRNVCRVLIDVEANPESCCEQIAERTGLTLRQVKHATRQLSIKGKLRHKENAHGKKWYWYNEDYTPPPAGKRRMRSVAAAIESRKGMKQSGRLSGHIPRLDEKVAALNRQIRRMADGKDRDLLIGLVADLAIGRRP